MSCLFRSSSAPLVATFKSAPNPDDAARRGVRPSLAILHLRAPLVARRLPRSAVSVVGCLGAEQLSRPAAQQTLVGLSERGVIACRCLARETAPVHTKRSSESGIQRSDLRRARFGSVGTVARCSTTTESIGSEIPWLASARAGLPAPHSHLADRKRTYRKPQTASISSSAAG